MQIQQPQDVGSSNQRIFRDHFLGLNPPTDGNSKNLPESNETRGVSRTDCSRGQSGYVFFGQWLVD